MTVSSIRHAAVVLATFLVVASVVPGIAAAESGISGTVVVEDGERVSNVDAVTGSVIVHGTVTGDVSAVAGDVRITGSVHGDVSVAAGTVRISGQVGGDVSAGAGSIHLEEGGTVNGNIDAGAGDVRIDGAVAGEARLGADRITLGETAAIGGSLTYDGTLEGNLDAVEGDITRDRTLGPTAIVDLQPIATWLFAAYALVANLLLGAFLLAVFPRFSVGVTDRIRAEPLTSGVIGLGMLVAVPIALVLLLVTVVGIPLALLGMLAYLFVLWIALVFGRFALGMWVLSVIGGGPVVGPRRWAALVVGLVLGAVLAAIPYLGGLASFLFVILGLGGLVRGLAARRRTNGVEAPAVQ